MASLLIPRTLAKRELGGDLAARAEVIAAWQKGVFDALPAKGVDGVRLLKAYVTTSRGPRRTLFLLQAASGDTVFLMHRPKGDPIGDNMSYRNPGFAKAVGKAMSRALRDIVAGAFDVVARSTR